MEEFRAAVEEEGGGGGGGGGGKEEKEGDESAAVDPNTEDGEVDDTGTTNGGYAGIRADLGKLIEDNDIAGKDIGEWSGYIAEQIQQESALTVQLAQARMDSEWSLRW